MNQSPLAQAHQDNNANFGVIDGIDVILDYGDPTKEEADARAGAGLIDLVQAHTFTLDGPDARRFANGMFTNNIRRLQPGEGNRSAMCDDRGRVQGLLDVYCTDSDRFEGVLEGVTADWFEQRYEMYIVFDDVEMTVSAESPWVLSLQGPQAGAFLTKAGLPTPSDAGHHVLTDDGIRVANKDRSGLGGFDIIVSSDQVVSVAERLVSAGAQWMGHHALEALRISAGRARWPIDGGEKTMVHELAINEEVCNFNKGCYLGQEVINRIDVKGQVNKRLSLIVVDTPTEIPVGSVVKLEGSKVGIVSSTAQSAGKGVALAVLWKTAWEDGTKIQVETENGTVDGSVAG